MKTVLTIVLVAVVSFFASCSNGQSKTNYLLSPEEFASKLKTVPSAALIDVRTPEEYSGGHLEGARNIDWKGADFEKQIVGCDSSQPVFVYCLSGGRSARAVEKLRSMGFSEVYELDGGILKWRSVGLPESSVSPASSTGMSRKEFDALLNSDKLVLIDFYATWCTPCKKMEPYFGEIEKEMSDKVKVLRIDVDANKSLIQELKVEVLPTVFIYQKNVRLWSSTGFVTKDDLIKKLKELK